MFSVIGGNEFGFKIMVLFLGVGLVGVFFFRIRGFSDLKRNSKPFLIMNK